MLQNSVMPLIDSNFVDLEENHNVKDDLFLFDSANLWNIIYERLKNRSALTTKEASCDIARSSQNRWKNRYRDISPYDENRVILRSSFDGDYINASYVSVPQVPSRKYILTQGPMQQTVPHFWLMVWECRSPLIVMLNRLYEKGVMRCFPYFPQQDGSPVLTFVDIDLCVRLEQETNMQFYIHRMFKITHLQTDEHHYLCHMHYTGWPDFGVPGSPSGMLNFLWAVRATGALSDSTHPTIVHCSAGVGRSGAFVLVDLALCMVEERGSTDDVNLNRLFLDLRRCRMGVIQTSEQLRFCYSAVARASDELLRTPKDQIPYIKFNPLEDEIDLPAECSDSDDESWEGLDQGECDSSVDELSDSDDAVNLSVFQGRPQEGINAGVETMAADGEIELLSDLSVDGIQRRHCEPRLTTMPKHSWLPLDSKSSPPKTSVGVGPGSPEFASDQRIRCTGTYGSLRGGPLSEDFFIRSRVVDRSNNAISIADGTHSPLMANDFVESPPSPVIAIESPPVQQEQNTSSFGDNASVTASSHPSLLSATVEHSVTGDDHDSVQSEYLAATYDLIRRREIRRQRQARIRERIEQTRLRMRELDLERKRWLPWRLLRIFRRFYAESGLVQSRFGAVAATSLLILVIAGLFRLVYYYWCG